MPRNEFCDCDDPTQCFDECGDLGHDEDYVEVSDEDDFIVMEFFNKACREDNHE